MPRLVVVAYRHSQVAAKWKDADENPKRGQPVAAKRVPAKKAGKENTKKSKKEVVSEEEEEEDGSE